MGQCPATICDIRYSPTQICYPCCANSYVIGGEMSAQFEVKDGFILPACYKLFQFLRLISVFTLVRFVNLKFWELRNYEKYDPKHVPIKCRPVTKRYVFPEAWALGNLIAAILAGTCAYLIPWAPLQIVILCYAVIRTLELFVYQVNVLLFDPLTNSHTCERSDL